MAPPSWSSLGFPGRIWWNAGSTDLKIGFIEVILSDNPAYGYLCSQVWSGFPCVTHMGGRCWENVRTLQLQPHCVYMSYIWTSYKCVYMFYIYIHILHIYVCFYIYILQIYIYIHESDEARMAFSKTYHLLWTIPTYNRRLLGLHYFQILQRNAPVPYKSTKQWWLNQLEGPIREREKYSLKLSALRRS